MDSEVSLGTAIKFLRTRKNITSRGLSSMCGLSPSYIGKLEAGTIQPSFDVFCMIAKALEMNNNEILFLVRLNQRKLDEAQCEHNENVDAMPIASKV